MAPSSERRGDLAGSKRKSGASSSGILDVDTPAPKRRRIPDTGDDGEEHATEVGYALLEKLRKARDKKNWPIATHFQTLPDRATIPEYYEEIALPIALDTIEGKLDHRGYQTTSALEGDIKRMIANAKQYNERTSQIFADAEKIRKMVSVYMEDRNPAYRTPGYQPVPTPIPEKEQASVVKEAVPIKSEKVTSKDKPADEPTESAKATRKSGRSAGNVVLSAPAKPDRRASSTPAAVDAEGIGERFEGNTFQQAQDKIISEMMNLTDDDNNLVSANFINLPSRALVDYYKVIKHPVSLKALQKTVRGIKGRDNPTGVSLLKSWDAFDNEVSHIWRNAREYNEDESEISAMAGQMEDYFQKRLAEAKRAVAEPPQPKVKLTMKAAPETPKLTLKFGGQKQDSAVGGSVDAEALTRQQNHVRAATNGQRLDAESRSKDNSQTPVPKTTQVNQPAQEKPKESIGQPNGLSNGMKREISHGNSPAPGASQPNGIADTTMQATAPPASLSNGVTTASPHSGMNGHVQTPPASSTPINNRFRQNGKGVSDALITNLNIRSHPDLKLHHNFDFNIPASPTYTQQSMTISLTSGHWRLLITPSLSPTLMQRPSKTFVTCNNRRLQALVPSDSSHQQPTYEFKLHPGTNTIEVEVIAGMPRGTPKIGNGPDIELEKITVFAHYQQ